MDWLKKYKPKSIDELVGNNELKQAVKYWLNNPDEMPHLLFAGKAGTGKTTTAYIIARSILNGSFSMNFKEINASNYNNVDFVRTTIINYMRYSPLLHSNYKILLLDEADYLTTEAQATLRRPLEKYKDNCRVIMTANNSNKIIEPIRDRMAVFTFTRLSKKDIIAGLKRIAEAEGVVVDLEEIADKSDGSMRKAIITMQQRVISGQNEIEKIITSYLGV